MTLFFGIFSIVLKVAAVVPTWLTFKLYLRSKPKMAKYARVSLNENGGYLEFRLDQVDPRLTGIIIKSIKIHSDKTVEVVWENGKTEIYPALLRYEV